MIKALISDFSRVLLFPTDQNYKGSLNALHNTRSKESGYKFEETFILNEELLNFYKKIGEQIDISVFTTGHIQELVKDKLDGVIKGIVISEAIGFKKNNPTAFNELLKKLNLQPGEVLYIDDTKENCDAAIEAGINAILYTSNDQIIAKIKKAL
jgi:FMN phosphatase YigB (HAD superfamily)